MSEKTQEQRDKRIDDMIRENNKRFRGTQQSTVEQKQQQNKQKAYDQFYAQEEKQKLRDYARKIQEENLRRTQMAKQAKKKKQQQQKLKKKRREREQQQATEKLELVRQNLKEQSRVTLSQEQLLSIERKISQKASQQLRRIKSEKQHTRLEQQKKRSKLQNLEIRRKNIIERTRKIPSAGLTATEQHINSALLMKENAGPDNIDQKKQLLKTIEQQTMKEIQVLNSLISQVSGEQVRSKTGKIRLEYSVIEQKTEQYAYEEQQGQATEQEDDQDEIEEKDSDDQSEESEEQYRQPTLPSPYTKIPSKAIVIPQHHHHEDSFQNLIMDDMIKRTRAALQNSSSSESSIPDSLPGIDDDIFKLSSAELMSKPYIRI